MQYKHNVLLLVAEQLTTENQLPAGEFTPLKVNGVVARSAPAVAAVAVGPAVVAALPLVLPLAALFLPPALLPLVPSAVAEVEPAVAAAEAPPNVGVKLVAPAKAGKPKVTPEEGKVKPQLQGSLLRPQVGWGLLQGQLMMHHQCLHSSSFGEERNYQRAAEHMWQNP